VKSKPSLEPPAGLAGEALARWQAVAPALARRGALDRDLLATYCQVWARWRGAEAGIAQTGQLAKGPKGRVMASPLIGIANQTATRVRALETRLGIVAEASAPPAPDARRRRAAADRGRITRRELAARLDVHMMTITKWERDGMPIAERGERGRPSLYDEAEVRAWIQARDEAVKSGHTVDVAQERAKKERAQAALAEQTYQIRAGELVSRADWELAKAAENSAIKAHLLGWSTTLADRLYRAATLEGVPGIERLLAETVREVLRELADGRHATQEKGNHGNGTADHEA
jgi:P27 family predicted phage terminase small subunit